MERIIEQLAKKYGLSKIAVEVIVKSMFELTAETMKKGELENVQLLHLGKFCVKPGKKNFILKKRKALEALNIIEKQLNETFEESIRDSRGILQLDIRDGRNKESI